MEAAVRQRVHQHLAENNLFDELRRIVAEVVGAEPSAVGAVQQKGVVRQAVQLALAGGDAATSTVSSPRHTGPAPTDTLLHVQLLRGRAFLESVAGEPRCGALTVCGQYGEQRFRSQPVPHCAEPPFEESFVVSLGSGAPDAQLQLLELRTPLHLLVLQARADGTQALLSSVLVEWRRVLSAGSCSVAVELPGVGGQATIPVGALELRLELLRPTGKPALSDISAFVGEAELACQLKQERSLEVEAERQFFAYARGWWADFLQLRAEHRQRAVKLFAMSELGVQRPVCTFVRPLSAGRLLDSPMQAAHFVSLLAYERSEDVMSSGGDLWHSLHSTLCRKRGDVEEHALLLCSLLLGFGLDAYVAIGTDARGPHVWVMSRAEAGGVTFWESLSGQRYAHGGAAPAAAPAPLPYLTLSCLFSHQALYANVQPDTSLAGCSLVLEDGGCWKPIAPEMLRALAPLPSPRLGPCAAVERIALEEATESELRQLIEAHRTALGLGCAWDARLGELLAPALCSYESERVGGGAVGAAEFALAVKRAVPEGYTFKGFPQHCAFVEPGRLFETLLRSQVCLELLQCRAERASFALRLRVFPFPEGVFSVWVMLALKYRPG